MTKAMKRTFTNGQVLKTPNGIGTFTDFGGWDIDDKRYQEMWEQGIRHIMVRHTIANMTSREHGRCITPNAQHSGLWMYEESEVK